jgi:hypothetical protein
MLLYRNVCVVVVCCTWRSLVSVAPAPSAVPLGYSPSARGAAGTADRTQDSLHDLHGWSRMCARACAFTVRVCVSEGVFVIKSEVPGCALDIRKFRALSDYLFLNSERFALGAFRAHPGRSGGGVGLIRASCPHNGCQAPELTGQRWQTLRATSRHK